MTLKSIQELKAYELLYQGELSDIHSEGYIFRHKKSGARISVISNDDDNKVFFVGFRTPPEDETGVPHIIEHTVLCGSEKYPVKDPFVELVKGSMNTFLNAITYPDKTVYPVASCNDQDFQNLMDVYLDAVFHPNIYKYQEIFKQEGWHYELEQPEGPLTINGVVYNEMKGACSSPDQILQKEIDKALYPDNAYSKNSGGNPDFIPELTYEDYLDFHRRYYHPVNSYIYLYGDMDIVQKLEWLDQAYLASYDAIELDSTIEKQAPFEAIKDVEVPYPISLEESEENNTYLSYNLVVSDALNKELYQAFDILDYALVSVPGSPIKKALVDAGIGEDVSGGFDTGTLQNTFSVTAKNANLEDKERFVAIINETLQNVVKEGIDKKSLLAGINSNEFRIREADFGRFPKGLLYGLQCMESWLFDDMAPFLHIQSLDTLAFLKKQIETDYFEKLVEKYLLNNNHGAVVCLYPKKGYGHEKEEALEEKLEIYRQSLSEEERQKIIEDTKALKAYQEEPSSKEELEKIPMLSRNDIRRKVQPLKNREIQKDDYKIVFHDYDTNGIDYFSLWFDARDFRQDELVYLSVLKNVLSYMDTEHYDYNTLSNEINIYTGGINGNLEINRHENNKEHPFFHFVFEGKVLEENLEKAMELLDEIILYTDFTDYKRLKEIIQRGKARKQQQLASSGHITAYTRALAGVSYSACYHEEITGYSYYKKLLAMDKNFEDEKEALVQKFQEICKKLFVRERLMISFTGKEEALNKAMPIFEQHISRLPSGEEVKEPVQLSLHKAKEAFTDASQIQYVAKAGCFGDKGYEFHGTLNILKSILENEYLWTQVRILGGAYGAMCGFRRTGEAYFVSYRDPNLKKTLEVYNQIPEFIENFNPDEREMTKFIIGTMSQIDTPLNPESKGYRSMVAYLTGISQEEMQKTRDQIIDATPADIRALAPLVKAVLTDNSICVIGNEDAIEKEKDLFDSVESLNE